MSMLFDRRGQRKYLTPNEREAFIGAAIQRNPLEASFCLTLAISGARISEVLALTSRRIDHENEAIIFETLKRRRAGVFRAVPMPRDLISLIRQLPTMQGERIWPWCRTKAWSLIKDVMSDAGVENAIGKPKALRHAFGVYAGQNQIPLNLVQRWLGHARIETTAIYADALGEEERNLAKRMWNASWRYIAVNKAFSNDL